MKKRNIFLLGLIISVLAVLPVSAETRIPPDTTNVRNRVALEPDAPLPEIAVNRTTLNFGVSAVCYYTDYQMIRISNAGAGSLDWTAASSETWIELSPMSGTDDSVVYASLNHAALTGLPAGTYTGNITISSPTATNSPVIVSVNLNIYGAGSDAHPFGNFATPIDSSTVTGTVPFTGWALDDIGIRNVKIYRGPSTGEGSNLMYIGDAGLIDGARPDVEAAYPGYPENYKAGWSYALVTHFLPNGGNGSFTFYVIATDIAGQSVTLGTKTIIVDNANAVKPFGAIDTPTQGGIASGSSYINWGWALTPQPNFIPTDGSTIDVWVDGVNLGHPTYDVYRSDIAALFPGYANTNGAVGYFYLDTTAYDDGVHAIQWTVQDSAGNTDGIGSRYFTIQNAVTPPPPEQDFAEVSPNYDPSTIGWGDFRFATIQDGIDNTEPGGNVVIYDATYTETVTLDKRICIKGGSHLNINGHVTITNGDFIAPHYTFSLTGDFTVTNSGRLDHQYGTFVFNGVGTQMITGDVPFNNVEVGSNAVVKTNSVVTVNGSVTNNGKIVENRRISGTGLNEFGLTQVSIYVTTAGLTNLKVTRFDKAHPNAAPNSLVDRYWIFTPTGSGYVVNMTLPHPTIPDDQDMLCRFTGPGNIWDCGATQFNAATKTITRKGITEFSDWSTGEDMGASTFTVINIPLVLRNGD